MYEYNDREKYDSIDESDFIGDDEAGYLGDSEFDDDDSYLFAEDEEEGTEKNFSVDDADGEDDEPEAYFEDVIEDDEEEKIAFQTNEAAGMDDDEKFSEDEDDDDGFENIDTEAINMRSPYLNPQPQRVQQGGGCLRLILFLLLVVSGGLLVFTYFKTGSFDVTKFFNKEEIISDKITGAINSAEKLLKDKNILEEGDSIYQKAAELDEKEKEKIIEEAKSAGIPDELVNLAKKKLAQDPQQKVEKTAVAKVESKTTDGKAKGTNSKKVNVVVKKTATPKIKKVDVFVSERKEPFSPMSFVQPVLQENLANADEIYVDAPAGVYVDGFEKVTLEEMTKVVVSGIMYDKLRPSAILKYKDVDYLVHVGDVFEDFEIVSIEKNNVIVKSGTNTYVAVIGQELSNPPTELKELKKYNELSAVSAPELISPEAKGQKDVNFSGVVNLPKKFAGAYKPVSRESIIINGK